MGTRNDVLIALMMGIGLPLNLVTFVHKTITSSGVCYAFDGGNRLVACMPGCVYKLIWGIAIGFLLAGIQVFIRPHDR